jgi:hypothetical protein
MKKLNDGLTRIEENLGTKKKLVDAYLGAQIDGGGREIVNELKELLDALKDDEEAVNESFAKQKAILN